MTNSHSKRSRHRCRWRMLLLGALAAAATVAGCNRNPTSAKPAQSATAAAQPGKSAALPRDIAEVVSKLDTSLNDEWQRAGASAAAPADDASYLRRVHLDVIGRLPSAAEVNAFVSDAAVDKRAKLVERLVRHPDYAKRWTEYFDQLFVRALPGKNNRVDRTELRRWLHRELSSERGWDKLVHGLITAKGQNSHGGKPQPDEWELPDRADKPDAEVNGAVNWLLLGQRQPQNLAGATSRLFLGVQIQCAECHDHPTETWKQDDFRRFTAAFLSVNAKRLDQGKVMGIRRFEVMDRKGGKRGKKQRRNRMRKLGYGDLQPTALDGTKLGEAGKPSRVALANWMIDPQNPWFAKAIVNRMWSQLMGHGFTNPIDDFRKKQNVLAPAVFDALTADFVANGYDLRRLLRVIAATRAYQLSSAGAAPDAKVPAIWQRFEMRPMNATQLLDAIVDASQLEPVLQDVVGDRLSKVKFRLRRDMTFTFDVDEESGDDAFTGTVPQALMLLNGLLTSAGSTPLQGTAVGKAIEGDADDKTVITQLYLAALSRTPEPDELSYWQKFIADAQATKGVNQGVPKGAGPVGRVYRRRKIKKVGPREAAYADMFWALLNSSEFFFIH